MSLFGPKRALLLVVAIHAALLWLWSPRVPPAREPERRATVVVVVPPAQPAVPAPKSDERVAASPDRKPTSEPRPARADRRESVVEALPGATTSATVAAAPVASPASTPASAPKPLDLTLHPRDALRSGPSNAAVNDPRSNAPRLSPGERMAQTLGSDTRLYEEIQPDGTVRLRQGTSCLDARQSRAAGLDPFNSAIVPKPRLMSAC